MKTNKPKHTKGPWSIESKIDHPYHSIVSNHTLIARVEFSNNAHLIAAAPEMLECIATIYYLANLQALLETKYSKALVNDIMKNMEAIIKKARGDS